METVREVIEKINDCDFVLIGIGDEFKQTGDAEKDKRILDAYNALARIPSGKPYFVISENEDDLIYDSKLLDFFITCPFSSRGDTKEGEEQWQTYMRWLSATLGHKLCILELGVGFTKPQLIKFPFEKAAQYNQKSFMIRVHHSLPMLPEGLDGRGAAIKTNALDFLLEEQAEV